MKMILSSIIGKDSPERRQRRRHPKDAAFRSNGEGLDLDDVGGLRALLSLGDVELHPLTLGEGLESIHSDGAEVDEDVFALVGGDKAVALRLVEPLNRTLCCQGIAS